MNSNKKKVVIFENQKIPLNRIYESAEGKLPQKDYIFEGVCAFFGGIGNSSKDFKNNNGRFYDRDEYLSLVEAMQPEIKQKMVAGSLDHPDDDENEEKDIFTPKMKDLSHLITALWYKKETDEVWIRIKLLDTQWGKDAMACADAGMPIFISSRASGYIEDDGRVILDQIHTYDIVYRPGFGQARLNPILESYERNSSSVAIFECTTNLNKQNFNHMTKKDKDDFVTEERLMAVCEKMQKDINKFRKINEEEINGKTIVSRVIAGKDSEYNGEFLWVKNQSNDDRYDLLTEDGTVVLSNVSSDLKSAATSLIQNYSRRVISSNNKIEDAGELIQSLKNNFEGNPFFENSNNEVTSEDLDKNKERIHEERYLQMLISYLQNSSDDIKKKYNYMQEFLTEVAEETIDDYEYVENYAQEMIDTFIEDNKDLVIENRAKIIAEKQYRISNNYSYIKESLQSKKITECNQATALVTKFINDETKPIDQKIGLIQTLNELYDECNYEICEDPTCTIDGFLQEVSSNPEIQNIIDKFNRERRERIENQNIVAKRVNTICDYLDNVAIEYNSLVSDLTTTNRSLISRIDYLEQNCAVMEARINKLMEYCELTANTVNNLIDHSDVIAKRINTVTDYAENIADTVNSQTVKIDSDIQSIQESLKSQKKENKRVAESLDSRLDKAIESVVRQKQTVAIKENTNKNRVFEDNGSLRIPLRYRSSWNKLSEEKRNEIICLFEYRNPRTSEEINAIWESLNLGSQRLITNSHKTVIKSSSLGYDDAEIDKLLSN